ncbi:MAG: hypothetical protein HY287_16590 [Planctomycetes bacterium]|nr:hypothetical protein [Planctomycetota bacterium]MBI3835945.1 hypothetical protein [Planctomycetota bacterium]
MAGRNEISDTQQDWESYSHARVWIGGHDVAVRKIVEEKLVDAERPPEGPLDAAFITPQTVEEAGYFARKLRSRLMPNAIVWVVQAKSGGASGSTLVGTAEDVVLELFRGGFSEAGRAAIDEQYISLGFRNTGDFFDMPSFV